MKRIFYLLFVLFLIIPSSSVSADVDTPDTVSLLHFDTYAGSSFVDESGRAWGNGGNVNIDTTNYVFGGGAVTFDGNGDFLLTSDTADLYLSSDFTISFRVRFTSLPALNGSMQIIGQLQDANNYWHLILNNNSNVMGWRFQVVSGGGLIISQIVGTVLVTGRWYAIEVTRSATNFYIFQNGDMLGSPLSDTDLMPNFTGSPHMGMRQGGSFFLDGKIDEFRLVNGFADHVNDYIVADMAYPVVEDVVSDVHVPVFGFTADEEFYFYIFTCIIILVLSRWWWVVLWVFLVPYADASSWNVGTFLTYFVMIAAFVEWYQSLYRLKIDEAKNERK